MASPVKLEITADDRDIYNKLLKTEKRVEELEAKLKQAGKSGSDSFEKAGNAAKKTKKETESLSFSTKDLLQNFIGIGGAMGALNMIIAKYKEIIEAQKESKRLAADTNVSLDQARANALLNLPTTYEGGVAAFDALAKRVSQASGMTLTDVYKNAGGPLSAKGSATDKQFEDAFTLASTVQQRTGGAVQAALLSGSILDVMKSTGLNSAAESLGYIRQLGAAARVQTLEGQLKLVPGLAIGRSLGDTAEQAAEMQAAISQTIVDPDGSRTGVLYKGMATALYSDDLVPYKKLNPATGKNETKWRKLDGKNTVERLESLQKLYGTLDEDGQKELTGKLSERQITFLLPALKNDPKFAENLAAARAEIRAPGRESAMFTAQMFRDFNANDSSAIANARAVRLSLSEDISAAKVAEGFEKETTDLWKDLNTRIGRTSPMDILGLEDFTLKLTGRAFGSKRRGERGTPADAYAAYMADNPDQFAALSDEEYNRTIGAFMTMAERQRKIYRDNPERYEVKKAEMIKPWITWGIDLERFLPKDDPKQAKNSEEQIALAKKNNELLERSVKAQEELLRKSDTKDEKPLPGGPNSQNMSGM